MFFRTRKVCTCKDSSLTKTKTCIRCNKMVYDVPLTNLEREVVCKKHKRRAICGLPNYICEECRNPKVN